MSSQSPHKKAKLTANARLAVLESHVAAAPRKRRVGMIGFGKVGAFMVGKLLEDTSGIQIYVCSHLTRPHVRHDGAGLRCRSWQPGCSRKLHRGACQLQGRAVPRCPLDTPSVHPSGYLQLRLGPGTQQLDLFRIVTQCWSDHVWFCALSC